MARLIDADATVIGLDTALACSRVVAGKDAIQNKALDLFEDARNFVAKMPTIDAVPVVRCKDCVHYYEREPVCLKIYSDGNVSADAWQERKPDDFCSYGERKDGADHE